MCKVVMSSSAIPTYLIPFYLEYFIVHIMLKGKHFLSPYPSPTVIIGQSWATLGCRARTEFSRIQCLAATVCLVESQDTLSAGDSQLWQVTTVVRWLLAQCIQEEVSCLWLAVVLLVNSL